MKTTKGEHTMIIKQLSIFAENRPGAVAEALGVLSGANINMRAFTIADTTDFGIIRTLVDDTDKAVAALRSAGLIVNITDVLQLDFGDAPGSFLELLKKLETANINVEYSYAYVNGAGRAQAILRVSDPAVALKVL
jgi:hypothetical protein